MRLLKVLALFTILAMASNILEAQPQHMGIAKAYGPQNAIKVVIYNFTDFDINAVAIRKSQDKNDRNYEVHDTSITWSKSTHPDQKPIGYLLNIQAGDVIRIESYEPKGALAQNGSGFSFINHVITHKDIEDVMEQVEWSGKYLNLLVLSPANQPKIVYVTKAIGVNGFKLV